MLRRISKVLLTLVLALSVVTAFGIAPTQEVYALAKKPKVTSVKLNHKVITIKKGKTLKLKATVLPKKAAKKAKLTWSTSKKKVATVKNGKVKAAKKKTGKAKITVKVKGTKKKAVCTVYVGTPVKKVVLAKKALTLKTGQIASAGAKVSPSKATVKKIIYSSSNKKVATVDKKGKIKAVGEGTAVITAKPQDEAGKKATLKVTVKKASVPVTGVTLDVTEKTIEKGQSFTLTATVAPADATNKDVTFASSDANVATVDASGKVTAVKKGTADITVTTADGGKTAVCKVTVTFPVEMIISRAEELTKEVIDAVKSGEIKKLFIKSDDNINIEIPKEDFGNASLVIDAPKGHVENNAKFKDVLIKSISGSSYVEHATGSDITYQANSGRLEISENASASILVNEGANNMDLVVNGNVDKLTIDTKANIAIGGATNNSIPTEMTKQAADSKVSTSIELEVTTAAMVTLGIFSGAEHTIVTAANQAVTPEIIGLGVIQVRYADSNDDRSIVAKNEGIPADTIKVNVSGAIFNMDGTAAAGVKVMLLPYTEELSNEQAAAKAAGAAKYAGVSDDNGAYNIAGVVAGNYYIAAQKSGFVTSVGKIGITGSSSQTFSAQDLIMIAGSDKNNTGKLSGKLVDAVTGDPVVAGLTVSLRAGTNNVSGEVIETVTTNSEGKYAFTKALPYGQYTVHVADRRNDENVKYAPTSFNTIVSSDESVAADVGITATVSSDQVRFVLSWGKEGSGASEDIDSHLVGPKADGTGQFHTWYGGKRYYSDNREYDDEGELVYENLYADLDRDDTDFEGPETTTIRIKTPGVYSFYVHDYTNRENVNSSQMARSSAVVHVYVGRKDYTYHMPNKTGILWYVCDYDSRTGKVTSKNEILSWTGETSDIGLSAEERIRRSAERLQERIDEAQSLADNLTTGDIKTEGVNLIKSAKDVKTSSDQAKIDAAIESLNNWMSKVRNAFALSEDEEYGSNHAVYTGAGYDDEANLIIGAYTEEFWDENEEEIEYRTLTIRGMTETLPADIKVSFANEDVQYSITNADSFGAGKGFEKMLVASYAGMTRNFYISYSQDEEYVIGISDVTATSEDETITDWNTDCDYDVEDNRYEILKIRGTTETVPSGLKVTPKNSAATAELKDADAYGQGLGFTKMVMVTKGNVSKNYYISYDQDTSEDEDQDDNPDVNPNDVYLEKLPEKLNNAEAIGTVSEYDLEAVEVPEYGIAYKFSVETSGSYRIWSSSDTDTYGELYNVDREMITENDDANDDYDFEIITNLEAGETYFIVMRGASKDASFTSDLHIAPFVEAEEE